MKSANQFAKRRAGVRQRSTKSHELLKRRSREISRRLARELPEAKIPLLHRNPFELLVATILSAQCTDEQVNRITPSLFRRFPNPASLAQGTLREIEQTIHSLGLFRSKAKALKEAARQLSEKYEGQVPPRMEALTRLRGVGRKTANVILGHSFGIPGIVVDTHVKRVSRRLGLTRNVNPEKIEQDLMEIFPSKDWSSLSLRLILHGRKTCWANKPQCGRCILSGLCPSTE